MKRLSIISGVLFLCTSLMAANKITGKIIDESNNQHIEYANVSLLTQDSTFITGVATDNGGGFLLKEVNDGDYILCISCVGYENSYLSIRNLQANLNLGELPLSPDNVMLEGVTVTASPIIKKTDRQIILPTEMQTKAASNGVSDTGYGEHNLAAKYHFNKSELSTTVYWGQRDLKWTRENDESFHFPEAYQENREVGEPTKVKYDNLNFNLNYSYQDNDKQLLNIALRNQYSDTPSSMSDRISTLYEGDTSYSISDLSTSKVVIPSLDIYYQRNLKNKQTIYADIVASYLDSKNERTFIQKALNNDNNDTDIYSETKGKKYSIIGEGIYEKQFNTGKFTGGIKHTQAYLQNRYSGNIENKITMNTAETYLFAEYQSKIKALNYTVGIGAMRTYNSQEQYSSEKYIVKPSLSLSYSINGKWFFRYNGYVSGYAPSLSDLNDISQAMDKYQIRKGNPDLKSVTFYANTLSASWQSKYVSVDLFGRYSYDNKPIMENTYYEDGHFVRTTENHKGFHRINLETAIQIRPYKEYISIKITPFLNRYISYGNTYTHTHTNAGLRGSLMAMYKNWVLMAEMNTSNHTLWGETLTKEEKLHTIMAGYNTEKWSLSAGVLNPFTKKYEQEIENLSKSAPYRQLAYSKNLRLLFMVNASFSLDFGKKRNSQGRRINNRDTDTGILSGSK